MSLSAFVICLFFFFLVFNHIARSFDYQGEEKKKKNEIMNCNGSKMKFKRPCFLLLFFKSHFSASNVGDRSNDYFV